MLRRVAKVLKDRCRATDMIARYGGEEFLLCFPDTNAEFAEQICRQLRHAVENADWSDLGITAARASGVTMSFGVAEAGDDSRRSSVLSEADTHLYRAKRRGRNRVVA